jgi:signal peptidase I
VRQPAPRWHGHGQLDPTAAFAIVAETGAIPQGIPGAVPDQSPIARAFIRALKFVGEALALVLLLALFFIRLPQVNGHSMEPQLRSGEHVLINTIAYDLRAGGGDQPLFDVALRPIARGDVVAFIHASDDAQQVYVKRVVGVPGDMVAIGRGFVSVNGRPLAEPIGMLRDTTTMAPTRVPAGSFFVLGDNRAESDDSRAFGAVPRTAVIGRAQAVVWPLNRATPIR